jgi:GT2 family glycosyltransferase
VSTGKTPIVFILCWERPLYLWACLDSLYHTTKTPCRFVLVDNASADPLVGRIIESFEVRGMFHRVYRRKSNEPSAMMEALALHADELGDYFGFVESDVIVLPSKPSWLEEFQRLVALDPRLGMVGSLIDKRDFVDPHWVAEHFTGLSQEKIDFLIKTKSVERGLANEYAEPLIDPFNPPGRLLYLKTEAVKKIGLIRDTKLYEGMMLNGHKAGIATRVRHRHLSLANIFDYPEHDRELREKFFRQVTRGKP